MPHLLQHGQHRINHTRTRSICPAQPLLDRLDDLVAMARLLRDQLQNDVTQIARAEEPHRPAASASKSMPAAAKLPATAAVSVLPMTLFTAFLPAVKTSKMFVKCFL